jgi:hypothetical protein
VRDKRYGSASGPATLGSTAKAACCRSTWCNRCRRWVDIDPGEQAARYDANLPVHEWRLALSARSAVVARSISWLPPDARAGAGRTGRSAALSEPARPRPLSTETARPSGCPAA